MRPKASSMITFGYIFLVVNLIGAFVYWLLKDRFHTTLFLGGSALWIVCILVWYKTKSDEERS